MLDYDDLNRVVKRRVVVDSGANDLVTSIGYAPAGGGCSCSADPRTGLPRKIVDPYGKVTYVYYDKLNRPTSVVRKVGDAADNNGDSDDAVYRYEYDAESHVTTLGLPEDLLVSMTYDEANRRQKIILDEAGENLFVRYFYDAADNVIKFRRFDSSNVFINYDGADRPYYAYDKSQDNADTPILTYVYDDNGNVTSYSDGEGKTWTGVYDGADRLTAVYDPIVESPSDKYTGFEYDGVGNRILMTDRKGYLTKYGYDGLNRLIQTIEDFGGADAATTGFTYDGLSSLTALTDSEGNETVYAYDPAGRVSTIDYPDIDSNGPRRVSFGYLINSNAITRTDQLARVARYSYDDLRRLTGRVIKDGATTLVSESFSYDRVGRLLTAVNGLVAVTSVYDLLGRIESTEQEYLASTTGFATTFEYTVDTSNKLSTRTIHYPGGRTVVETADQRGRTSTIDGGSGVSASWLFDANNRRLGGQMGGVLFNEFDYDDAGRLTDIKYHNFGQTRYQVSYGYDAVGNRTYTQDDLQPQLSEAYTYDRRHRLTEFRRGELDGSFQVPDAAVLANSVLTGKQSWTLDSRGNWSAMSKTVNGVTESQSRTHNGANEILSVDPDAGGPFAAALVTHDKNGNLTLDPLAPNSGTGASAGQAYIYDAANRLTEVRRTADSQLLLKIGYDALDRRVVSSNGIDQSTGQALSATARTWHVYDGLNTLEEYDATVGTSGLQREFVWGPRFPEPLAMIDHTDAGYETAATAEPFYYLTDVLGSVVALTDSNGDVVERYTYDPYGQPTVLRSTWAVRPSPLYDTFSTRFFHDADEDGDIDSADAAHLESCLGSSSLECVFYHDRTFDNDVDIVDQGIFLGYYPPGGAAPPQFGRPAFAQFDANGDSHIDLLDYYRFHQCLGSNGALCVEIFDVDTDGTVTASDYAASNGFASALTAPGYPHLTPNRSSRFGNPFMWTGQRYDATTGTYHFLARSYSAAMGRWLRRDPLGYLQGLSLYAYTRSSPLRFLDPLGLCEEPPDNDMISTLEDAAWWAWLALAESGEAIEAVVIEEFEGLFNIETIAARVGLAETEAIEATKAAEVAGKSAAEAAKAIEKAEVPSLDGLKEAPTTPTKNPPKRSPNFIEPTNPPQDPPTELPEGHTVVEVGPTEDYPNGYWKQLNKYGQPVDPSTTKPPANVSRAESRARTHVRKPPPDCPCPGDGK